MTTCLLNDFSVKASQLSNCSSFVLSDKASDIGLPWCTVSGEVRHFYNTR